MIWVFPELNGPPAEISKLSAGLLTEARYIADKVGGRATAMVFGGQGYGYPDILKQYGLHQAYVFKHSSLTDFSAEIYAMALIEKIQSEKPWLILMGNTTAGKELVSQLAVLLNTGVVSNCVKMDMENPAKPVFYRPTLGEQAYQGIVFQTPGTMLVTMDPKVLNITPINDPVETKITVIEPDLSDISPRIKHLDYLPADYQTIDVADAETIVSAGAGAVSDDLLPLVQELAVLLEGAIGTTRPVADEGKIAKERMIGQTGKMVSPELYLALGISGASHHIGGIQEAGRVISVNSDPQAPIFQSSDAGAVADLKEILPRLIEKIKKAKNG